VPELRASAALAHPGRDRCRTQSGEIFEIDPAEIPPVKLDDFSMHQLPTSNLLRELQESCGVEVRVLACQTGPLPEEISQGLSKAVSGAVPQAAEWLVRVFPRTTAPRGDVCQANALQTEELKALEASYEPQISTHPAMEKIHVGWTALRHREEASAAGEAYQNDNFEI
jgi:hypothetical protein